MTTGRSAPAEIVNPKSHLNGTSAFGAAEAEAAGLAPPVAAGAQLASATAAAPFNSVRRPILVLIATLPDRPISHREARSLRTRLCPAGRHGSRRYGRPGQNDSVRLRYSSMRTLWPGRTSIVVSGASMTAGPGTS